MIMKNRDSYILGIDTGTTGLKTLLIDVHGNVRCRAYREYAVHHPHPDWVEQDPEDWWEALCATVREILEQSGVPAHRILGMGISSQGSTFVLLDEKGELVRPAVTWLDRRAEHEEESESERIFDITGLQPFPGWTGTVLKWFHHHEPNMLKNTKQLLLVGDYLGYRLTGEVCTDFSSAARTRLLDLRRQDWCDDLLDASGVLRSQMPRLGPSGKVFGKVTSGAARVTGLCEGMPVVLGGFDQSCAMLGAGAVSRGILMVSLGTATMVCTTSPEPFVDSKWRVTTSCHALPNAWVVQAPIMTTGALLRWWRDHFFPYSGEDVYRRMDVLAATISPGADGLVVLPYFSGRGAPDWDREARGVVWGLTLAHEQGHVIRAILEGVAMEIRANVEVFEQLGFPIHSVRIVGGGAKSVLWRSIIGDVLGKPQSVVTEREVGCLGAAILAATGVGLYNSVSDAVREMTPDITAGRFSEETHRIYDEVWERYREVAARFSNGLKSPSRRFAETVSVQEEAL